MPFAVEGTEIFFNAAVAVKSDVMSALVLLDPVLLTCI